MADSPADLDLVEVGIDQPNSSSAPQPGPVSLDQRKRGSSNVLYAQNPIEPPPGHGKSPKARLPSSNSIDRIAGECLPWVA